MAPAHGFTAAGWFQEVLRLSGAGQQGKKWQCPGHGQVGEHSASLMISEGRDGRAVLFCHAGCETRDICSALGVAWAWVMSPSPTPPKTHVVRRLRGLRWPPMKMGDGSPAERGFVFEAEHCYGTAWLVRLRHSKTGAKELTWESLNHKGERVPGLLGRSTSDLPLYRDRELDQAVALDEPVLVVESESSADALKGFYCTTWAGGAAKPATHLLSERLGAYRNVIVIPDDDEAGQECLEKLKTALPLARTLTSPRAGEDAKDLYQRVGARAFGALVEQAMSVAVEGRPQLKSVEERLV